METEKRNILTDHLDETLQGRSLPEAEAMISEQDDAREEWEYLNLSVEAIRHQGLVDQVAAIRKEYAAERGRVRMLPLKKFMRAAAVILIVLGLAAVYKFYSVSGKTIYDKHYTAYELPVSRGNAHNGNEALILAWQQKNWKEVIRLSEKATIKDNQLLFLAGTADMELRQYNAAIENFQSLLLNNRLSGEQYYQDEAEYYLALSFLASNQNAKGIELLQKIKSTPGHLYSDKAGQLWGLDLKILEYKTGKHR